MCTQKQRKNVFHSVLWHLHTSIRERFGANVVDKRFIGPAERDKAKLMSIKWEIVFHLWNSTIKFIAVAESRLFLIIISDQKDKKKTTKSETL